MSTGVYRPTWRPPARRARLVPTAPATGDILLAMAIDVATTVELGIEFVPVALGFLATADTDVVIALTTSPLGTLIGEVVNHCEALLAAVEAAQGSEASGDDRTAMPAYLTCLRVQDALTEAGTLSSRVIAEGN